MLPPRSTLPSFRRRYRTSDFRLSTQRIPPRSQNVPNSAEPHSKCFTRCRLGTERMSEVTLRQRVCGQCYSVFWICPHCDRGQRYCNLTCRMQARRAQRRRANRRHQQSREGREDHRDRQREYRRRCRLRSGVVTDKGSASLALPGRMPSCEARTAQTASQVGFTATFTQLPPLLICAWCGRRGLFVDRFP